MSIRELIEIFIDPDSQRFELQDNDKEKVVFTGYLSDLPEEYDTAEVTSIDNLEAGNNGIITLNVCVEEE